MKLSIYLISVSLSSFLAPVQAKGLWASTPAPSDVLKNSYPVGNGRLGGG
jgi:hypothetical protein